jgi:hypothetical protein
MQSKSSVALQLVLDGSLDDVFGADVVRTKCMCFFVSTISTTPIRFLAK